MTVLTEEMVFARTKTNNLSAITKLNCWGSQLSDVKLLRRMTNVQVLSLSVNNIESLEDMQYCTKLQDLFVRKNNITDLNEVCYLKDLAHLRNLWLGDNPCANEEGYRLAVIKALPNLTKLDNMAVEQSEYDNALRFGRTLSLDPTVEAEYYSEPEEEPVDRGYERYQQEPVREEVVENNHSSHYSEPHTQYYKERERDHNDENGHGENNHHPEPVIDSGPRTYTSQHNLYDERPEIIAQRNIHSTQIPRSRTQPNVQADPDFTYGANDWKRRNFAASTCCIQPHLKRPSNERRTNVLNAVLCLVKELDFANLEVVQMAVKCRMEELALEENSKA
ncbi:LRRcap [Nesidiocoris tenuis]|uniref:LRRcap n=1 Tax=Nesidiocoris tenuis TaxID=355587 RepID=A0ABN7AA11_9HEMI|nr:LRRcap [Nesidiocoris tenuis]